MRNIFSRIKSAYWSFINDSDCCDCLPGLEMVVDDLDKEVILLTKELERVNLENANLKREVSLFEVE